MSIQRPWREGIKPMTQVVLERIVDDLLRAITNGRGPDRVRRYEIVKRCEWVLQMDPLVTDFVGYVHGVANGETNDEFIANGPTDKASRWMRLGDQLQELTGQDALGGP